MRLFYRIWIGVAAGLFALLAALQLFFVFTDYGFLHQAALYWLCLWSFLHLIAAIVVWLCRQRLKKSQTKIWISVGATAASLGMAFVFYLAFAVLSFGGAHQIIGPGRWHQIYTSPQGSNRIVVFSTGFDRDNLFAYPMLTRWIYRETDNNVRWRPRGEEYRVQWEGEHRAVVHTQTVPMEHALDAEIIVEFE